MKATKLKPCPFCGSNPTHCHNVENVMCEKVGCPIYCNDMTILMWQTRPTELNIFKAGERFANDTLQKIPNPFRDLTQRAENYGVKWMRDAASLAILTDANNRTELP